MDQSADKEKQFDVLYASLCELQTGLLDSTSKVAGFLLLATGWLATSKDARIFLQSDPAARYFALAALTGAFALYAGATVLVFRSSRKTSAALGRLDYMPPTCYENRRISLPFVLVFTVGNLCLFALTAGMLFLAGTQRHT